MCDSGYSHSTRMEVVKSRTKKFYRQILEEYTGGKIVFRNAGEMTTGRRYKSMFLMTWFKSTRGRVKVLACKDLPWFLREDVTEVRGQKVKIKGRKGAKGEWSKEGSAKSRRQDMVKKIYTVVFFPQTEISIEEEVTRDG